MAKTSTLAIYAERLQHAELFEEISASQLYAIAEFCTEESYQDGENIFSEDEHASRMFVVERGKIALEKRVQMGRHSTPRNATIDYATTGQMVGFSAITAPHIYATSATCTEPTRVIAINGGELCEYLELHPEVGFKLMDKINSLIGARYKRSINTLTYFLL